MKQAVWVGWGGWRGELRGSIIIYTISTPLYAIINCTIHLHCILVFTTTTTTKLIWYTTDNKINLVHMHILFSSFFQQRSINKAINNNPYQIRLSKGDLNSAPPLLHSRALNTDGCKTCKHERLISTHMNTTLTKCGNLCKMGLDRCELQASLHKMGLDRHEGPVYTKWDWTDVKGQSTQNGTGQT